MSDSLSDRIRQKLEEYGRDLKRVPFHQEMHTRRRVKYWIDPMPFGPAEVRQTRYLLQMTQMSFAVFLGVTLKTVQAWERGSTSPSKLACRFMDSILEDPAHWLEVLEKQVTAP